MGVLQISGEMARGPTLAELIPDKIFLGTSLILRQSGGTHAGVDSLLYGVRAPRVERGQQVLGGLSGAFRLREEEHPHARYFSPIAIILS